MIKCLILNIIRNYSLFIKVIVIIYVDNRYTNLNVVFVV